MIWNAHRALVRATSVVILAGACSALSFGQKTFSFPHVLESSGRIAGIAWNLTGGQFTVDPNPPAGTKVGTRYEGFDFLLSLYGNDEVLQWMIDNVNGKPSRATYAMYGVMKDMTVGWAAYEMEPAKIEFPNLNVDSKDPAGIRMLTSHRELIEKERPAAFKAGAELAKKQKMFLPSNFRFTLGDLPCTRVNKVEALAIKQQVADLDGDGNPEVTYEPGDVVFEVPMADAAPFQEAFRSALSGQPRQLPLRIDYLDADGGTLMSVLMTCAVVSAAPSNIFLDRSDSSATLRVKAHKYIGTVTIVK